MAKTIYDKPTRVLLKDMLIDIGQKPGQVCTTSRALKWFRQRYPKLRSGTISAHLVQAATCSKTANAWAVGCLSAIYCRRCLV